MIGEQWMLITAGTAGAVQHHDGQLGRPGRAVGGSQWPPSTSAPSGTPWSSWSRRTASPSPSSGREYRKALALCGSKSGRDVDKVKECGFTVAGAAKRRALL